MALEIVPYRQEHESAVQAFNARLAAGRVPPGFRLAAEAAAGIEPAAPVLKRTFLVMEGKEVRGAYILQEQEFVINGVRERVGNIQLPLSEGLIDKKYMPVAAFLARHIVRENPLQFCVGMGGIDQPWPRLLSALGWKIDAVPFFFRVVRGGRFLRQLRALRTSVARRVLMDAAAVSGIGDVSFKLLHAWKQRSEGQLQAEAVEQWGAWADAVWENAQGASSFCGLRDSHTLPYIYPVRARERNWRLIESGRTVGWFSGLVTPMSGHDRFGDLRVGTMLDCFTEAGYERKAINTSVRLLSGEADLIVANHSHTELARAYLDCGFLRGPSNYLFATSKELTARLATARDRAWITRGDGDGRINL